MSLMKRICYQLLMIVAIIAAQYINCDAATSPELPRVYMQTVYALPVGGTTYQPKSAVEFQNALNTCKLGDVIELQAGTIYKGPFTLPNKTVGSGWIYIISNALASLPQACNRVSPADAPNMPVLTVGAGAGGAVQTVASSHHYRFVGIEIRPDAGKYVYSIVQIGNGEKTEATLPNNIVLDRCYIHGDPIAGSRRGVLLNGAALAVIDCYVSDCKEDGADSQALASYSATGPIKITNNYLEGAGENVIFGGSDPSVPNAVSQDIEIRCNHFFKPLKWMQELWDIKNLLEFKNAQRVLVEGNTFENCWPNAQSGFALLLTPRNQNNTAPWSVVQDITIRRNTFINVAQGINMSGFDSPNISQRTSRVLIQDNLLKVVQMPGGDGRLFQVLNGVTDVAFDHNTGFCPNAYMVSDGSPKTDFFSFTNNIVTHANYGFIGSGTAYANTTLAMYFNNNWTVSKNVDIGGSATNYPVGNFFPPKISAVGFVDTTMGNYRLAASSPYKNAGTDGKDLGADLDSIAKSSTYICDAPMASVKAPVSEKIVNIYPNPADQFITIETNASDRDATIITISDELGKTIFSQRSSHNSETINITELPNGVYFLYLQSGGILKGSKILVQH